MFALAIAAILTAGEPASDKLWNRLLDTDLVYELNEKAEPALTCFGKGVQAAEAQSDPRTIEAIKLRCGVDRATAAAATDIKLQFSDLSAEDAQALVVRFIDQMAFWATLTRFPVDSAGEEK